MSDLLPEDMLTAELPPGGEEVKFYLYVDKSPAKVKLAFSVQADRSKKRQVVTEEELLINFKVKRFCSKVAKIVLGWKR